MEHLRQAMRLAMWWGTQASNWDRQWKHLNLSNLSQADCPAASALQGMRVDELRFRRAPTDLELDAAAELEAAAAAAAAAPADD